MQVNPGETFTITTEDGHIQCIQGKGKSGVLNQITKDHKYHKITAVCFCYIRRVFMCSAVQ